MTANLSAASVAQTGNESKAGVHCYRYCLNFKTGAWHVYDGVTRIATYQTKGEAQSETRKLQRAQAAYLYQQAADIRSRKA